MSAPYRQTPKPVKLSRLTHALLAPVQPGAAAALLKATDDLRYAGWSAAQIDAELKTLSTPQKETAP